MSVSATTGLTSSARMPSASAICMATEVRVPPISVEPSTRLTVPSALTLAVALDFRPMLNQKPDATPRPNLRPVAVAPHPDPPPQGGRETEGDPSPRGERETDAE